MEVNKENLLEDIVIVAITGAISSGKSSVCSIFKEDSLPIIDTDYLAKTIINSDTKIKEAIIKAFGEASFIDGKFNTKYIANLIFGNEDYHSQNLQKLNSIIHPRVIELMIKNIEEYAQQNHKLIFVESALIFEAGLEDGFDYIIMVDTNEEIRKNRFILRTGLSENDFNLRNNSQISPQFKKENSDFIIENNKNLEQLRLTSKTLLEIIKILPKKDFSKNDFAIS